MTRMLLPLLVSLLPINGLRVLLYRLFFGYRIARGVRIGFGTLISVTYFEVGSGTVIGPLNVFKGPIRIRIGSDAKIGRLNQFFCSWHIVAEKFAERGYTPILEMGDRTLILNSHFFDIYGRVEIGHDSWIAGNGSQFWTHGLSVTDRDIHIGEKNYIGSAVRFAPGTSIGDRNIVALGSVVLGKVEESDSLISGFPAKAIRSIAENVQGGRYRFSFEDW